MFASCGLPGDHVDLVDWLEEPLCNDLSQGFRDGAKETFCAPIVKKSRNWSPALSEVSTDLSEVEFYSNDNLDDCLALDLKKDNWHEQLTGEDAKWAREVAEDYKQLKRKRDSEEMLFTVRCDQPLFGAEYNTWQEPNVSPVQYQAAYSPFSHASEGIDSGIDSPQPEFCSPVYENIYSPDHIDSRLYESDAPLRELNQQDICSFIESGYESTEPSCSTDSYDNYCNSQSSHNLESNHSVVNDSDDLNVSSIVAFENDFNTSFKEESTIEIKYSSDEVQESGNNPAFQSPRVEIVGHGHGRFRQFSGDDDQQNDPGVIYCKKVSLNARESFKVESSLCEAKPLLKDVISENGDDILNELVCSPEPTFDLGSSPNSYMDESLVVSEEYEQFDEHPQPHTKSSFERKVKRVPFTAEERKLRKKEQNKRAALRYREKKKMEEEELNEEYISLLKKNKELKEKRSKTMAEFEVILKLMTEKFGK